MQDNTQGGGASMNSDLDGKNEFADIVAQATLKYSIKDYDAAADLYSKATEMQAETNGEMSSQNAELLYAYGRCLYHLAIKNSDVLGDKVARPRTKQVGDSRTKKPRQDQTNEALDGHEKRVAEEIVTQVVEDKDMPIKSSDEPEKNKPYFQFTGDENWDTSEAEEEEAPSDNDGADAEEEDDLGDAYEVLDLARVLLLKRLEELEKDTNKATPASHEVRQVKERLADTYDLQAEISLEGERFPAAVIDLKSALELKVGLFPQESSMIAEAHYKLSLALEFSSVTQPKDADGESQTATETQVDDSMREEAAKQMEAAIASCKMRTEKEEIQISSGFPEEGIEKRPKVTQKEIEDVKEMVTEMEQRVSSCGFPKYDHHYLLT